MSYSIPNTEISITPSGQVVIPNLTKLYNAGYAISLPTTSDNGVVSSTSFADNIPQFSVSLWINTTQNAANAFYVGKDSAAQNTVGGWSLDTNNGQLFFQLYDVGGVTQWSMRSNTLINDGAWHHILATYNTTTGGTMYVDGVSDFFVTGGSVVVTNYANNATTFFVGDMPGLGLGPVANITNVQLWNTILTASNALTLAQGGSVSTGLIGSWAFTEGTGTTAVDTIGGNTLTFTAITWDYFIPAINKAIPSGANGAIQINSNGSFAGVSFTPTLQATFGGSPFTTSSTPSDTSIVQPFIMATPTHRVKVTVISDGYQADAFAGMDAYLAIDGAFAAGSHLANYGMGVLDPAQTQQNSPVFLQWIFTPGDSASHTYSAQYASSDNSSRVVYPNINATMIIEEII